MRKYKGIDNGKSILSMIENQIKIQIQGINIALFLTAISKCKFNYIHIYSLLRKELKKELRNSH